MSAVNKTLKKFGILALITIFINITSLLVDIFMYEFSIFSIIVDSIGVALTLFTGIIYLCYAKKSANVIAKRKNFLLVVSIINIFNNLIIWFISFYVYSIASAVSAKITLQNIKDKQPSFFNNHDYREENQTIIDVEECDAQSRKEILVRKLEELKSLQEQLLISKEEYARLREEAIKEFIQ